ncbi:LAFA_0D00958g1_1 [Lachancea sp. 'fantastica']|nr:LAFA_0D00958g1_1 [Lachancea sp. 'fantastica']
MSGQQVSPELAQPLRTKILVVFENQVLDKDAYLSKIFNLEASADTQIYKNIEWSTKYYRVSIDVYVDYVDELKPWVDDFCSPEYGELRDALAGCIFIRQCKDGDEGLAAILKMGQAGAIGEGFISILATEFNAAEDIRRGVEEDLLAHGVEVTTISARKNPPENDCRELHGISRIKEIIDTFQWDPKVMHTEQKDENISPQEFSTNLRDFTLDGVMGKLQEARAKYLTIESTEERESFARDVADEISELL